MININFSRCEVEKRETFSRCEVLNAKRNNHFRIVKLKNAKRENRTRNFRVHEVHNAQAFFAFSRFRGVNFTLVC